MTCIVGDPKRMVIVADTQISDDDSGSKDTNWEKVFAVPDGWLAGAGDVGSIQKVVEWYRNGKPSNTKPEIKEDNDADFMLLSDDGIFLCDKTLEFWKIDKPDGIGSGHKIAVGAMMLKHKAEDAVWVATQIDLHSGGRVVVYQLGKKPVTYHKKS